MIRKRILFFAEAVTLAHVARPFVLAQALDPERFEVYFACDPRYHHLLGQADLIFKPLHSISTEAFLNALAKGSPLYNAKTLREYVDEDLAYIKEIDPDLIVGDFRLSLAVSTQISAPPCMLISNAYWSPYAKQKFPIPEHFLTKLFGVTLAQTLFRIARFPVFAHHSFPLNLNRREYGLIGLGLDLRRVYTFADQTLYADVPELVPAYSLPHNHHYLGPILWSPAVELPDWWDKLPRDKAMVYITLGSSGHSDILEGVLNALSDLPVAALVATAGAPKPDKGPPDVWAADFLPGDKAAERALLVVCNGGSPTSYQGLTAGVPILGIPSNLDQHLNMQYVERYGAGKTVRSENANPKNIQKAVVEMLHEPAYAQKAKQLAAIIAKYDAPSRFRELVEKTVNPKLKNTSPV